MAIGKATCKCDTCGKVFTVTKECYNRADADSWVTYAEANYCECSECYRKRKAAERLQKYADIAAKYGMPTLTGTEKQIKWANKIRAEVLKQIEDNYKNSDNGLNSKMMPFCFEEIRKFDKATDFIDRREFAWYEYIDLEKANRYRDNLRRDTMDGTWKMPGNAEIERLKEQYPVGSRVELVKMDDPQAPKAGTQGTVHGVDDTGSIMVTWDNGSELNIIYGIDICRRI